MPKATQLEEPERCWGNGRRRCPAAARTRLPPVPARPASSLCPVQQPRAPGKGLAPSPSYGQGDLIPAHAWERTQDFVSKPYKRYEARHFTKAKDSRFPRQILEPQSPCDQNPICANQSAKGAPRKGRGPGPPGTGTYTPHSPPGSKSSKHV